MGSRRRRFSRSGSSFSDPLALVQGTSSVISFETDVLPQLIITEQDPSLETTAYGLLADFLTAVRSTVVTAPRSRLAIS